MDFSNLTDAQAIVVGAILGGVIGSLAAVAGSLLTHWLERGRARDERTQRDAEWRREQDRRDDEWFRERVANAYSDSVYYLVKLSVSARKASASDDKDVRQHFSEAQRHLILLRSYRADEDGIAKLVDCSVRLAEAVDKTIPMSKAAEAAVEVVKQLLKTDSRVSGSAQVYVESIPAPKGAQ
jgi:hypothetical protein